MGKYIIAIIAPNETGKTSVVKTFWNKYSKGKLLNTDKKYETIGFWDEPEISMRIGVNSLGDTIKQIQEGLAVLLHYECDIIVCTARNENALITAKDNLEKTVFECHLDDSIVITPTELEKLSKISRSDEYSVITCGHFSEVCDRISLTERDKRNEDHNRIVGGVNLNEFTAEILMELIEKLS